MKDFNVTESTPDAINYFFRDMYGNYELTVPFSMIYQIGCDTNFSPRVSSGSMKKIQ